MAEKKCIENPTESQETSSDEIKECDPCLISDKSSPAGKYCSECEENLCEDCARNHSKRKATSSHKLILIQETHSDTYSLCNPCTDNEKVSKAVSFCDMCEEYLCSTCTQSHKIRKATRLHEPINIEELNRYKKSAEKIPSCALCEKSGIRSTALHYCEECEEYLCEMCKESHSIRRATKLHRPVPVSSLKSNDSDEKTDKEETSKMCDPCTFLNKCAIAISFCTLCEELLCADCTNQHRIKKLTKSHVLKRPECAETNKVECGICESKTDQRTVMYCYTCEESLCERCVNKHQQKKLFKNHSLRVAKDKAQNPTVICDPCKENNEMRSAETFCKHCEEHLCVSCTLYHRVQKITKHHDLIDPKSQCPGTITPPLCDPCSENETRIKATSYCTECEENFCDDCGRRHKSLKISKNHEIVDVSNIIPRRSTKVCNQCQEEGRSVTAVRYCADCQECFCAECCQIHKRYKVSKSHSLIEVEEVGKSNNKDCDPRSKHGTKPVEESLKGSELRDRVVKPVPQDEKDIPGKPSSVNVFHDTITLSWDPLSMFGEKGHYQISYKYREHDDEWKILSEVFTTATAELKNLKSNTSYIFRVRVVYEDNKGPWSEESNKIHTLESTASPSVKFAVKVKDGDPTPAIYALPMTEIQTARDEKAMIRKFEFGGANSDQGGKAKTIMLFGAVETGKSTMVDGIINYMLGVKWDNPFRFTVTDTTQQEANGQTNNDASKNWITTYTINPQKDSILQYQLNIIDTPGLADSSGLERNQQIIKQVSHFLSERQPKGVTSIDAVCLLVRAPYARLTVGQSYIYQSIMSLFANDTEKNVCSLITFAEGMDPPVLLALRQLGLPFGRYFVFNNSSLFAKNVNVDSSSLTKCFWDMGFNSFHDLFVHMELAGTKSLRLTKVILNERARKEYFTRNLQTQFEAGLATFNDLKQEMKIISDSKTQMNENKDFEYEVEQIEQRRTDLPRGQYVNNCRNCNFTCHKDCTDKEKNRCSVMNASGNCTVCPDQCHWSMHAKTPYVFEHIPVKVKKTFAEMQRKYEEAAGKLLAHEQIEGKLRTKLDNFMDDTGDVLLIIKTCNESLQGLALRSDPLTRTEYIDLMVENEKLDQNPEYRKRISLLNEFRNSAQISTEFDTFIQEVNRTLGNGGIAGKRSYHGTQSIFSKVQEWFKKS